jgi:hypothetical protein
MNVALALALFWLAAGLYALAGLAYMGFLIGAPPIFSRVARLSLLASPTCTRSARSPKRSASSPS